jgi:hypothetical protein
MWDFADLRFSDPFFFVIYGFVICGFAICRLKTSASPQIQLFLLTNIAYDALIQICTK